MRTREKAIAKSEHPAGIQNRTRKAPQDLGVWLVWRCFTAKRAESVPLFGGFGLASNWECSSTHAKETFENA